MDRQPCTQCGDRLAVRGRRKCYRCRYKEGGKSTIRGLCEKCGEKPKQERGGGCYYTTCWKCRQPDLFHKWSRRAKLKKKRREELVCQQCGFKADHSCQIDVDHIDGNRNNNEPSNLQLLCANCHRLKTIESGDHLRRYE